MQFSARISSDGKKLKFQDTYEQGKYAAHILTLAGKKVTLTVADIRSDASNSYYWVAVVEFFRGVWSAQYRKPRGLPDYTKEEAHEALVQILLGCEDGPHGARIRKRTRDLSQEDFSKLIKDGKEMAWQDYKARIPDPGESLDGL